MPKITVKGIDEVIEYNVGQNLLEILIDKNIFIDNPCNGRGLCGKCRIKLLNGNIPPISETERSILKEEDIMNGIRIACLVIPNENICISLLTKEREHQFLTESGYNNLKFKFNPAVTKINFIIRKPDIHRQLSYEDSIVESVGTDNIDFEMILKKSPIYGDVTGVFYNGRLIYIEEGDTTDKLFGVALDIGTTTVVCSLIDINTGDEYASLSILNEQKAYGLDVLTRITYELENPDDGKDKLQNAIIDSINKLIFQICEKNNVNTKDIYEISIAANCTMMHMLLGIDAVTIGKSPYSPIFIKSKNIFANTIGLKVAPYTMLYCLPSVSSYIGADIVAGAYACKLHESHTNTLFIDIGTNGEIVLSLKGKMMSCSCAAGPALEGMNISCGMRAAQGAIEEVVISEEGVKLKVIGDREPEGICGSGILSVVSELVRSEIIRKDGGIIKLDNIDSSDYRYNMVRMNGKKREFILTKKPCLLTITQGDIRQVQLAKGAILSGFYSLLNRANISIRDLSKIMIAGQFGAHVTKDSLIGTGILPEEAREKIVYVGNSSKTGSYMALMSVENRKRMEILSNNIEYIELSATKDYERLFADCLLFNT